MSAYLQRLYDAAGGAAVAVDARPAQLSSSPLLAVDQRLTSTSYAASFLLSLPGEADPEPGPAPGPDEFPLPEPARRDAGLSPAETVVRVPAYRPAPAVTSLPDVEERGTPHAGRETDDRPPTSTAPAGKADAVLPKVAPTARAAQPRVAPPRTLREATQAAPPVERRPRRSDLAAPLPSPPEPAFTEPSITPRPVAVRPVEETADVAKVAEVAEVAPPSFRVDPRAETATAPPTVHPTPPPAPEPVPPPPEPRADEPAELDEQVRRQIREAMTSKAPSQGQTGGRDADATADTGAPSSRPRTAEAMSVIGPIDRPARASTLYGLRLR